MKTILRHANTYPCMLIIRHTLFILFLFCAFDSFSQQVKGVVTDDYGNPLPAVNVFIKNTTTGSTSEVDGKFNVEVRQGVHVIVFKFLGYETVEKEVYVTGNRSVELNVTLKEDTILLYEAFVYADRRDIAKKVMKEAREMRSFYLNALQSYSCLSYRKVSLLREYPPSVKADTIFDQQDSTILEILQPDSLPVIKVSSLHEYYSRLFCDANNFKEEIIGENDYKAKRPSGSIGVSMGVESRGLNIENIGREWRDPYVLFHDASSVRFNFLQPLIYAPEICEKPLLSPLAPTANVSYRYDFEGVYYENDIKIFRILVTPLFPGDALFSGHVFIEDSTWALRGVDLNVNPRVLLFCNEFKIRQNYQKINDSILVPSKTEFYYTIKDGKTNVFGNIDVYYSQYETNLSLPKKTFSNEIIRYDVEALERDSLWWINVRPYLLNDKEIDFAAKIDSLQQKYQTQAYIDSIDSAFNNINIWSFLIRGVGIRSRIRQSEFYFLPLIAQINPVGIGGYRHRLGGFYNKRFSNDMLMETDGMIDYGFNNEDIRGRLGVGLTYIPQKFVRTYIRAGDYYDMINDYASIGSIFSRSNYVRTQTISIAQRMEIFNGFFAELTLSWSDQTPITDMYIETWSNQLFGSLNQPSDFERYKKFDVRFDVKYRINQKYIMKGKRKIILESNWPEISLTYRKGIPGLLESEVNYDFIEAGIYDEMKLARWGSSNWSLLIGSFVNKKSLRIIEHRYFRGSDPWFFSDPLQSFQLLDATLSSSSTFFRANYMHHFEGAIMNKVPLVNRLKISLAGGGGILLMDENNFRHVELFGGIERVFRIRKQLFRIGVFAVTADDNLSKARFTYKFGLNFYNPFTRKWDY